MKVLERVPKVYIGSDSGPRGPAIRRVIRRAIRPLEKAGRIAVFGADGRSTRWGDEPALVALILDPSAEAEVLAAAFEAGAQEAVLHDPGDGRGILIARDGGRVEVGRARYGEARPEGHTVIPALGVTVSYA